MNNIVFKTGVSYQKLISDTSVNYAFSQNLCKANIEEIVSFAKSLKVRNFVQLGIGGSALAASA
ncbi:MAG TPA: hypothetical protein ENO40_02345, partial [Desulfurella acetivorans]|nr:hypothetical protein [Desulfurella acetivorans]